MPQEDPTTNIACANHVESTGRRERPLFHLRVTAFSSAECQEGVVLTHSLDVAARPLAVIHCDGRFSRKRISTQCTNCEQSAQLFASRARSTRELIHLLFITPCTLK